MNAPRFGLRPHGLFAARPRHAFAAAALVSSLIAVPAPAASACDTWRLMPSPPVELTKIAAASPRNVMALGGNRFFHWNGSEWRLAPGGASAGDQINAIAAVPGTRRYWAVGQGTLALRWNGTRWLRVPSPRLGFASTFTDVVPLGPRNVWAVGWYRARRNAGGDAIDYAISAHWNGRRWELVRIPPDGRRGRFYSADAASRNSILAVGSRVVNGRQSTLAARWDGSEWNLGAFFRLGRQENVLAAVSAASRRAAWAVGYTSDEIVDREPLTLRWNGRQWRRSVVPSVGARSPFLTDVEAVSAREAWAIGENGPEMLVLRWDGRRWRAVEGPPTPARPPEAVGRSEYLLDMARAPGTRTIWVVGTIAHFFEKPGYEDYDVTSETVVARFC